MAKIKQEEWEESELAEMLKALFEATDEEIEEVDEDEIIIITSP